MKIVYISSEERARKNLYIMSLSSFLAKDEKVLIINMDSDRELEILFEVEDYIIYDNLDYFSKISDLEQSITE
ncbi:cell division inhibitor, partial [Peptostreptococcaceae bacterium OttesenSCG-928-C18]|nr:cell division inhibitor [Peptostreptococcaceae bacterium OttesenSCG-928-C18]